MKLLGRVLGRKEITFSTSVKAIKARGKDEDGKRQMLLIIYLGVDDFASVLGS